MNAACEDCTAEVWHGGVSQWEMGSDTPRASAAVEDKTTGRECRQVKMRTAQSWGSGQASELADPSVFLNRVGNLTTLRNLFNLNRFIQNLLRLGIVSRLDNFLRLGQTNLFGDLLSPLLHCQLCPVQIFSDLYTPGFDLRPFEDIHLETSRRRT
jgi:hypothetical protein